MKKLISFVTAMLLLFGLCSPAIALDSLPKNWSIMYVEENNGDITRSTCFANLTDVYMMHGDKSLYVSYQDIVSENKYLQISQKISELTESGTYHIEFYYKGTLAKANMLIGINDGLHSLAENIWSIDDNVIAEKEGQTGWKKCEADIDVVASGGEQCLKLIFKGKLIGAAIDDISLKKSGSTIELIKNSGFEETEVIPDDPDEPGDNDYIPTEYEPTRAIVFSKNNYLVPSWKNPSSTNLTGIKLYLIDGETETLVADEKTLSVDAGGINQYVASSLKNSNAYVFRLAFSFSNHDDMHYFMSGTPSNSNLIRNIGDWLGVLTYTDAQGYLPAEVNYDTKVKKSGKASAKLVNNLTTLTGNTFLRLYHSVDIQQGEDYLVEYWMKAEDNKRAVSAHINWIKNDSGLLTAENSTGTYDWKKYSYTLSNVTPSANNYLNFIADMSCGAIWIDDVSVYRLEDGEKTGTNLISDGGFENNVETDTHFVGLNFLAQSGEGSAELTWENPDDEKYIGAYLYSEENGKNVRKGFFTKGISKVSLTGLGYNAEYKFILKPVNKFMAEVEEETAVVTTSSPPYKVFDPVMYINGVKTEKLTPGKVRIESNIANFRCGDNFSICIIAALYKGNELVDSCVTNDYLAADGIIHTQLSALEVPDDDNEYHIELYTWDSMNNMEVLLPFVIYN